MMSVAAAVAARQRRKILDAFRGADALGEERAVFREQLGLRDSGTFRRLVRAGVLVDAGDRRYYLDEEAAARAHHTRVQRFALLMGVLMAMLAAVWILERV